MMKPYKNALKLVLFASLGIGMVQGAQASKLDYDRQAVPLEVKVQNQIIKVERVKGRSPSKGQPTKTKSLGTRAKNSASHYSKWSKFKK